MTLCKQLQGKKNVIKQKNYFGEKKVKRVEVMKHSIKSKEFDHFDFEISELVCIEVFIESLKIRSVKTSKIRRSKDIERMKKIKKKNEYFRINKKNIIHQVSLKQVCKRSWILWKMCIYL